MTQTADFRETSVWGNQRYQLKMQKENESDDQSESPEFSFNSNSLSGNERNRMFLRNEKGNFADVSLISGADDTADGRSFAMLDFDRDGWTDIAMMGLNAPRFRLYRNRINELFPDRRVFRFRLVGGHTGSEPSDKLSNRDAIGARAKITFESGRVQMIHKQAGEGFAGQNSEVLSIGVPANDEIVKIDVRWPAGSDSSVSTIDMSDIQVIRESD